MTPDKKLAVRVTLRVLRNPLMLMSIPDREQAVTLVKGHEITVADLIEVALEEARNR